MVTSISAISLKAWSLSLIITFGFLSGCDGADGMDPERLLDVMVRIPVGSNVPGCETTDACFTPATVTLNVGGTVTWNNDDTAAHTVTGGTPEDGPQGTFDSSLFLSGRPFSHRFDEAGTFPYFCMVHPWQTGTVIVEE